MAAVSLPSASLDGHRVVIVYDMELEVRRWGGF